ncbi:NAD-dependent epimerase/dehydratase family protein [Sodalis sp. C49]|uniref:NAD-dependent epimerase/dehydratase family protein n=1 Tax=Sodalis sp. C49 TaxID=3228929 RepID=UPI003965B12F
MKIFITGATGYIGGSVAVYLSNAGHQIRGLVRNQEKISLLAERGIAPVFGDLHDVDLLIHEARQADIVVNAANSDDENTIDAFLSALQDSGKSLIHTSGTSVVADAAGGNSLSRTVFEEQQPLMVPPAKQARRNLDLKVLAARGMRGIVLCNSLIYGEGKLPETQSVQIPLLVNQARASGVVRIVGKGLNSWSNVHIDDVSELYRLAVESAPAGAFYFVENGETSFAELGRAISERLHLAAPESWTEEEAAKVWGLARARYSLGSNSRVRSNRARQELGWKPNYASVIDWIRGEMKI